MANRNHDGEEVGTQESSTISHARTNVHVQPDYQDPMAPTGELAIWVWFVCWFVLGPRRAKAKALSNASQYLTSISCIRNLPGDHWQSGCKRRHHAAVHASVEQVHPRQCGYIRKVSTWLRWYFKATTNNSNAHSVKNAKVQQSIFPHTLLPPVCSLNSRPAQGELSDDDGLVPVPLLQLAPKKPVRQAKPRLDRLAAAILPSSNNKEGKCLFYAYMTMMAYCPPFTCSFQHKVNYLRMTT